MDRYRFIASLLLIINASFLSASLKDNISEHSKTLYSLKNNILCGKIISHNQLACKTGGSGTGGGSKGNGGGGSKGK